jgi:glutathione S-transferase
LVHDGAVHIESNDIIQHLEKAFPEPRLIPQGRENEVAALLKHEDDLHLDLRTLSFRFVFAPPGPPKSAQALQSYAENGSGTVQGLRDREKDTQIEFWQRAAREGFTDERARASAHKFRAEFEPLDRRLAGQPYLMGQSLSVLDIAWFIYAYRLSVAGYPLARLHPHLAAWFDGLMARPAFAEEIAGTRKPQTAVTRTLEQVAGF